ncbi:MAG: TetR/AcrR family transcriptional regulator [Myxococcota bacterium]
MVSHAKEESPRPLNHRERQREETRQRVLEAALTIFRRDGVHSCRIEDIAALAGVSRGSFYFHFPTKEAVLVEVARLGQLPMLELLEHLPADASLEKLVDTVSEALAAQWHADPEILPHVVTATLQGPFLMEHEDEFMPLRPKLARRLKVAQEQGELRMNLPSSALADLLLVHLLTAMLIWCKSPSESLPKMMKTSAMIFLHGVSLKPFNVQL